MVRVAIILVLSCSSLAFAQAKMCSSIFATLEKQNSLSQKEVRALLFELNLRGSYFKSDRQAAIYFMNKLMVDSDINRTIKYVDFELSLGKFQDGQYQGPTIELRFYTDSNIHLAAVQEAHSVFGERIDYLGSGVMGIRKKKAVNSLAYFEGTDSYNSESGHELLKDSRVNWKHIKLIEPQ